MILSTEEREKGYLTVANAGVLGPQAYKYVIQWLLLCLWVANIFEEYVVRICARYICKQRHTSASISFLKQLTLFSATKTRN